MSRSCPFPHKRGQTGVSKARPSIQDPTKHPQGPESQCSLEAKITAPCPLTVLMSAVADGEPESVDGKRRFSFTQSLGGQGLGLR